jgi:exodeoxyribonuclease-3
MPWDILALQEVKAFPEQLDMWLRQPKGYETLWHPAEKPGYSGLAVFTKHEPLSVKYGLGQPDFDREGRVMTLEFNDFYFINAYFPNSQRDHARLSYKLAFCQAIQSHCDKLKKIKSVVLCGDFNIAHKEIDLRNPKSNVRNAGFLPEERAWLDEIYSKDYVDCFRVFNSQPYQYTWWSYRPGVREKNIGWRLDYFVTDHSLSDRLDDSRIYSEIFGSDHCPVSLELR